jgi:hypothetical protein
MKNIIIFLSCLLVCCAPGLNKNHNKTIERNIDIQQAKNIAIEYIKQKYKKEMYIKDSISVHKPIKDIGHWEIWIKTSEILEIPTPPYLIIIIDKITGKAEEKTDWEPYGYF